MIQRKQTLFLLLALAVLSTLMIWPIDLFVGENGAAELLWKSIEDVSKENQSETIQRLPALAALIVSVLALNIVGVFAFKNRPLQMRLVGIACGIEVGLVAVLVYMSFSIAGTMECGVHFNLKWLAPLAAAILDFLAYRRISDDEALIRSLDRLR